MDIEKRCHQLKMIYDIYDAFTLSADRACRRQCAACCTCNVTCTTLEGWLVYEHLMSRPADCGTILNRLPQIAPGRRFQPQATINQMVEMCVRGEEPPDDQNDPAAGGCPLLEDDLCSIYAVRPFGCRAMVSTQDCAQSGEARMPALVLTANNLVMQYLEALDRPGASGNMIDILTFLSDSDQRQNYLDLRRQSWPQPLQANQGFSVLMIPPEHRKAVEALRRELKHVVFSF